MVTLNPKFTPLLIALISIAILLIGFGFGYLAGYFNKKKQFSAQELTDTITPQDLMAEIHPENIRHHLSWLTRQPHLSGTDGERSVVDYISRSWKSAGLDPVKIVPYDVLLSFPNGSSPNRIQIRDGAGGVLYSTQIAEPAVRSEQNDSQIVPPFNAYSATGSPEGQLVYVNYGRVEDFQNLTRLINITGCICIARYGKIFRGNKAKLAEQFGCSGLILYTDPADFAVQGTRTVYPDSWWLPGTGVQRGSLKLSLGDPLTPLYPATESAFRLDAAMTDLPRIPVHPVGYQDAAVLMRNMTGPEAPPGWKGDLGIPYRLGPGYQQRDLNVKMKVSTYSQRAVTYNVVGFIEGSVEPDRYVILGNHHDAWVFGAVDPSSGSAVMLEVARAFGEMKSRGWRPRRSLVFCAWGAEEQGLIGSREWVENFGHILGHRTVAYLNVDLAIAGNHSLRGRSLPLLKDLLYQVTKVVPNPDAEELRSGRPTVYDTWAHRDPEKTSGSHVTGRPNIPLLGSGSDFDPFISGVGITSLDIRYNFDESHRLSSYPLYHSAYETMHLVETYIDPTFKVSAAVGQVWAELARRLADSDILPFNTSTYATALGSHLDFIEKVHGSLLSANNVHLTDLRRAVERFTLVTSAFQAAISTLDRSDVLAVRRLNDQLIQLERNFVDPPGVLDRRGQRHVIYAPSANSMYAGAAFPGLVDSLFGIEGVTEGKERARRWDEVRKQVSILVFFVETAADSLRPPTQF